MTELSDNGRTVLAHLLTAPNADHTTRTVAAATGLTWQQVQSVFALLVAQGWAVYRDSGGNSRPLTLTSVGRSRGFELAQTGEVGVPLRLVDRDDPVLADRVRAKMGWPLRHAS